MNITEALQMTWLLTRLRALNYSKQHRKELPGGVLDPQMKLLTQVLDRQPPMFGRASIEQVRADFRLNMMLYRKFSGPVAAIPNVWNQTIRTEHGAIPVRCYMPDGEGPFPIFVYYHGGGWVLGNLDLADNFARSLCHYGNMAVISVSYRLAPEHPFPAGFEDCYAAYLWAADPQNAASVRGDVNRLIVGGDSAGGNLAAAVCLKAREENGPRIAQQVLIYPATDLSDLDAPSYEQFNHFSILSRNAMRWYIHQYLKDQAKATDGFVSPALAESHAGLPPAVIMTAEFDVLRDDGENYAETLKSAGVDTILIRANGLTHGFISQREMVKRADVYTKLLMEKVRDRVL
jgi:acetyl esterase